MKKFNVIFCILLSLQSFAKIDSVKIVKKNEGFCFSWVCANCQNSIKYKVYAAEEKLDVFPQQIIDEILPNARCGVLLKGLG